MAFSSSTSIAEYLIVVRKHRPGEPPLLNAQSIGFAMPPLANIH